MGSPSRFLLKSICLVFLITLGLGDSRAQAGRSARVRAPISKAKGKTKTRVSRVAGVRTRSRGSAKLRGPHSLRLAAKRSALRPSLRALPKAKAETRSKQPTSKQGKQPTTRQGKQPTTRQGKGRTTKQARRRTSQQRTTKQARRPATKQARHKRSSLSLRSKAAAKIKKIAKAMGKTLARVKALPAVQRIANRYAKIAAATTRGLDRLQARAPPWLAKSMNALRTYSIVSLAAFNLSYLSRDAKFLGSYFAASSVVSYGLLPAATTLGLNPVTSTVLNAMTTPISVLVLVLRDVHLKRRAGESTTMAQSAKSILRDYKDFATKRRAESSARALAMGSL